VDDWLGLAGARVLIAGAGGLGRACADGFSRAGAFVMVADIDETNLREVELSAGLERASCGTIQADFSKPGVCREVVDGAVNHMGGIDVLVHCIGVNDRRPILEIDDKGWDRLLETNLTTAFRLAQAVGGVMCRQAAGRIVFLSSVAGLLAHKNHGAYAASKGGLNQLMRVMAAEWASSGVCVNAVAPGYVETPLTSVHLAQPGVRQELVRLIPAGRLGYPEEVVGPVLFLSSKQASFVTGHVLYVDGGRTLV
jgi:gluconate 5-dehydrogenase